MSVAEPTRDRGAWTIPNLISVVRLGLVPVFLWLLLAEDRPVAAGILLAVLGATDWFDGYIARHFDQGSELGKLLDPTADRVLLFTAVLGLMLQGSLPIWLGVLVFVREVAIGIVTLSLVALRAEPIPVLWVGKAGTLALMFGLPAFLLEDATGTGALWPAAWGFTLAGLALSYYAALRYIPLARRAVAHRSRSPR